MLLFGRAIGMRHLFDPSTIHDCAVMSRYLNIKKSIQYPQEQLPCQIPGGSVQQILSAVLTPAVLPRVRFRP